MAARSRDPTELEAGQVIDVAVVTFRRHALENAHHLFHRFEPCTVVGGGEAVLPRGVDQNDSAVTQAPSLADGDHPWVEAKIRNKDA